MQNWPLLTLVTFLPLVGVAFILVLRGESEAVARNARWIALWTSLIDLALSLGLWAYFNPASADFQFVELAQWLPGTNIAYVSVSRGKGPSAEPAIVRVDGKGNVTTLPLGKVEP